MRIKSLDVGVERITQFGLGEDVHLPPEGKAAPAFLPQYRPLDAILQRPSLDERLPELLQPANLDPDLLAPAALAAARADLRRLFTGRAAAARGGRDADVFAAAADLLDADEAMDEEVRAALALLLRG
jgi:hypothetical protein